jgi:hypothetical protein
VHMPGYLDKVFLKFKHVAPSKKQNSPHPHIIPQYGAKTQYLESQDKSPLLNKEDKKHVQAVMGTLLYYPRAVDSTILTALSSLETKQAKPMQKNNRESKTTVRLLHKPKRDKNHIQQKQNGPGRTQQCRILQQEDVA